MNAINMLGQPCPIPVIEAKKALALASAGDGIAILVDNDIARRNLEKMASGLGHGFSHQVQADGNILATITVCSAVCAVQPGSSGLVAAIGRQTMGSGSEELGRMLMKSFIQSLTEVEAVPEHILFFNGGVFLTTEGSSVLDDLNLLAGKGALISSCGACLNYYGLTEKLKVGSVSNMYAIANTMAQAGKLINM